MSKSILIVCTSASKLGDFETGLWLEELAAPYWLFVEAGHKVTLASTKGGEVPLDPNSLKPEYKSPRSSKFLEDKDAVGLLKNSKKIDDVQDTQQYDGIYIPGGHGAMVDFPDCTALQRTIATLFTNSALPLCSALCSADKVVGSVCHGPAAFVNVKIGDEYMVKGKEVTAFSDSEEKSVGKDKAVPFLLEDKLKEDGALYTKGQDWHSHAVFDGNLVTGQNPQSSEAVGQLFLENL